MEFGKFKDATSLLEGYKNLEKAFTKKCQEVKALESRLEEESNAEESALEVEKQKDVLEGGMVEASNTGGALLDAYDKAKEVLEMSQEPNKDENVKGEEEIAPALSETQEPQEINDNLSDDSCVEKFKSPEWRKEVAKFFAKNEAAKAVKSEIAKVIINTPDIRKSERCLELAYSLVQDNRPASIENLEMDKQSQRSVAPEEEYAKDKEITLSEYLELLAKRKSHSPKFLAERQKTIGLTSPKKITSLSEASDYLLKNYFK